MLPRIIDVINTELKNIRAANGYEPPVQISTDYSGKSFEKLGPTPRLTWTFGKDRFTPTKHLGMNPHQGKSMESEVFAHCFHKSPDDVYNLVNDVVSATRIALCEPSIISITGEMLDPGENAQDGYGYKLSMVLDVTILDPGLKYQTVVNETLTAQFVLIQPQI